MIQKPVDGWQLDKPKGILIIDFMNYVHRARAGFVEGQYAIIFNFFRNLRSTIEKFEPSKIFFAFEGHPKHRYALYPEYKANRIIKVGNLSEEEFLKKQESKDSVFISANEIKRLLQYLPVAFATSSDFEADDVIATLAHDLKDEDVTVLSSDTDFIQLLQDGNLPKLKLFNAVKKEFVAPPAYPYLAWKCITGDKSDNIPSIKGNKTAIKIISDPEKFKEFLSLEENRALFNINKQLIEFNLIPLDELVIENYNSNFESLKSEFQKMEFESITNDTSWQKFKSTFDCVKF
jgi:5'-3' exonuclease